MEDVGRGGGGGQEGEGVRGAEVMDCCSRTGHYILLHSHLTPDIKLLSHKSHFILFCYHTVKVKVSII